MAIANENIKRHVFCFLFWMHTYYMVLAELMEARLHWHNKRVSFPHKMSVPDFISNNRDLLNQIAKELEERYSIKMNTPDARLIAQAGIKRYLTAEGMLKNA